MCLLVLYCRVVLFEFVLVCGLAFLFVAVLGSPVVGGWVPPLLSLVAVVV